MNRLPIPPALILFTITTALTACGTNEGTGGKEKPEGKAGEVQTILSTRSERGGVQVGPPFAELRVGQPIPYGARLKTVEGVRARVALADGSVLHLNEQTEIELSASRRLLLHRGELLARVEPGAPLELATRAGVIRVTGTKLNVRADAETTRVDVSRGTVEIEGGSGARLEVGAGERAVLRRDGSPRVELSADLARVTRWAREVPSPGAAAEPSIQQGFGSLTARVPGRGQSRALALAEQKVRVVVRDNIARTEIEQAFHNPSGQTLEGTYRFPLPPGASISRLALWVGDRLEEGEIVERHRARRIFRKIVDDSIRPRDPALLEWIGGRTFQMRIFPIPPRASRRVIIAYTQPLNASYGRYQYVYPMSSSSERATRVGRLSIDVRISHAAGLGEVEAPLYPVLNEREQGAAHLRFEASDFVPRSSFVVNYTPAGAAPELRLALYEGGARGRGRAERTSGDRGFLMAALRPELPRTGKPRRHDLLFVVDSSHSAGKAGLATARAAVSAFLSEMDLRSRFDLIVCDARCRGLNKGFREPRATARKEALALIAGVEPGGSSDLQGAFVEAARLARSGTDVHVVYIGDGRPSAGELREPQLAELVVAALRRAGATLSALQVGEDVGEMFLDQATRRLAGRVHRVYAGDDVHERVFEVVAAQYRPTLTDLEATIEGVQVEDVYPRLLPTISAGGEVIIVGRYARGGKGALRLRGRLDGQPFERRYPISLAASDAERSANTFIPRLWALHHIDALSVDDYDGNRSRIVSTSKAYTVLSRATAFLVLENERMYREFKVKRQRQRGYWKGGEVALRKGRDEGGAAPATKQAAKGDSLGGLGGARRGDGGGTGAATGGSSVASSSTPGADAPLEQPRAEPSAGADEDDSLADAKSEAEPADREAGPAPTPRAPAPARVARARRASAPRLKRPAGSVDPLNGLDPGPAPRRYHYRPRYVWQWVDRVRIDPLLAIDVSPRAERALQRLERGVRAQPRRRTLRRRYHRELVRQGRYDDALQHALEWSALEGRQAGALRAVADMQAATGEVGRAMRSYASMVDVEPWSASAHRQLAQMYRNKGELRRACAHVWSLVSLAPKAVERHLDLARCLAEAGERAEALGQLARLAADPAGRGQGRRIERVVHEVEQGRAMVRPARRASALSVSATWDRKADLDIVLVTPRGERISALYGVRRGGVEADSHDGRSAERLALRWARNGRYRVEIVTAGGGRPEAPISGTALIKLHGKSRVVPFVLGDRGRPLASLTLDRRRIRRRY